MRWYRIRELRKPSSSRWGRRRACRSTCRSSEVSSCRDSICKASTPRVLAFVQALPRHLLRPFGDFLKALEIDSIKTQAKWNQSNRESQIWNRNWIVRKGTRSNWRRERFKRTYGSWIVKMKESFLSLVIRKRPRRRKRIWFWAKGDTNAKKMKNISQALLFLFFYF